MLSMPAVRLQASSSGAASVTSVTSGTQRNLIPVEYTRVATGAALGTTSRHTPAQARRRRRPMEGTPARARTLFVSARSALGLGRRDLAALVVAAGPARTVRDHGLTAVGA